MEYNKQLTDVRDAKNYIHCNKCVTFTLVSSKTGKRFTYKLKDDKGTWLVYLLTGDDNTQSYTRIGRLYFKSEANGDKYDRLYVFNQKERWPQSVLAIKMCIEDTQKYFAAGGEFWISARCRRCGRLLTTPDAIKEGIGHRCKAKEIRND